jgi:hypothetical protein
MKQPTRVAMRLGRASTVERVVSLAREDPALATDSDPRTWGPPREWVELNAKTEELGLDSAS